MRWVVIGQYVQVMTYERALWNSVVTEMDSRLQTQTGWSASQPSAWPDTRKRRCIRSLRIVGST